MADDESRRVIQAAALVLMDAALRLLQNDLHSWGARPCQTCRSVGAIVDRPFGCYVYAQQQRQRAASPTSDARRP